jgi:hypothetical protein
LKRTFVCAAPLTRESLKASIEIDRAHLQRRRFFIAELIDCPPKDHIDMTERTLHH